MLTFPNIDPVLVSVGPISVHWYGVMYLLGFLIAYLMLRFRRDVFHLSLTEVSDLIFYAALGVLIGGRLGYMLFYDFQVFLKAPWQIVKIWQGGMSFHGGLIGVAVAAYLFARRFKRSFLEVADMLAPLAPLGIALGRLGNFINGELWGRVSNVPWAMIFPEGGPLPRHPSELYEMVLEGFLLFIVVFWYSRIPRRTGRVAGLFLMGYAVARMIAECFREPDIQMGFIWFDFLTMGQILSIPMFFVGMYLWWGKRNEDKP